MKGDEEILRENYVRLDVDMVNELHRKIQELLYHQQLMKDRRKKIDKLRHCIDGNG